MANRKLTEEQQKEINLLLATNEMLEKSRQEALEHGKEHAAKQIERAQDDTRQQLKKLDPDALKRNKAKKQEDLFGDTDMSIFDIMQKRQDEQPEEIPQEPAESSKKEQAEDMEDVGIVKTETVISDDKMFNDVDPTVQYDVIELPSGGQCYKNKMSRVPVAYLTAYDENIITSPNLYKDGLVIDFLLKNKIVNKEINPDDLVSGDVDAIILFLRATSYGADFPIVVKDPDTGEQIDSVVDLTTLKPKDFKLVGDENGHFEFITPIKKDVIKFRYLTRKQEKQLQKVTELESIGAKGYLLERERETIMSAMLGDKRLSENDKKSLNSAMSVLNNWAKKLKDENKSQFNKLITNNMELQITAVNGNYDRAFIKKYVNSMPARDSLMLRRYINENKPGINFDIEVQRPESLGGGSFKTFLNWDDSVFLNIPDV